MAEHASSQLDVAWMVAARARLDQLIEASLEDPDDALAVFGKHLDGLHQEGATLSDLLLAARFLRGFEELAELDSIAACGTLTIFEGLTATELARLPALVRRMLAKGLNVSSDIRHIAARKLDLLVLAQGSAKTGEDQAARLEEALALPRALLLLRGGEAQPLNIAGLPAARKLAAIDREILALIFERRFTPLRTGSLLDALPRSDRLKNLPSMALLFALQAADLPAALARLHDAVAAKASGPSLASFEGSGDAYGVAKQMTVDLLGWRDGRVAWSQMLHSLLLSGAPGVGKTWLARAMGREPGIGFVAASFADWQSRGHLGDMLAAMAGSFASARAMAPCILFIDEIDAVGSRDATDTHGSHYRRQVVNALLEQLDRLVIGEGVVVVGACNDPAQIDRAILRPGRFDVHVEISHPGPGLVKNIIEAQCDDVFSASQITALTRAAIGLTPAAIDARLRHVRTIGRGQGIKPRFEMLEAALAERASVGAHRDLIAHHEAAHAVVAEQLQRGDVVHVMLTESGGEMRRSSMPSLATIGDYYAELAVMLAGRAAEKLAGYRLTAGSGGGVASDIAQATALALHLETQSGLGAEGALWFHEPNVRLFSDPGLRRRVHRHLQNAEHLAADTLARHRSCWLALAERLVGEGYVAHPFVTAQLAGDAA